MAKDKDANRLYLGVDVGGTKVLAALVEQSGAIVARERVSTPRDSPPEEVLQAIMGAMDNALAAGEQSNEGLKAIGITIPGVVDPDRGRVIVTPNLNLSGMEIVPAIEQRFDAPVAMGNDVNMGTLGEKWLGAARNARSAVGIFVGTGIGGGVIVDNNLVRGGREAAGEIGHLVMQVGGPLCGCGNRGCLEALASRTAIERNIREAIAAGRESSISAELGDKNVIKSKMLKRALKAEDPVVTEVMRAASEMLGYACLSVRHLIDPDVIILGGGVIEACGSFVLPIVREVLEADSLPGARPGGYVVESELGDDAVVLGAVALAQELVGDSPFDGRPDTIPKYPKVTYAGVGEVAVGGKIYKSDIYIRCDGKVKKRDKKAVKQLYGTSHKIGPEELEKVCKGTPEVLVIGMGNSGMTTLTAEGEEYLRNKCIAVEALPNKKAVKAYNRATGRKAALFHASC